MKYQVWYMRPEWFRDGICGDHPDPVNLEKTHIHLKDIEVRPEAVMPLEHIFFEMQAENWSPNGEARSLIEEKGLQHTSMSVGDVIVSETGMIHVVSHFGFTQLGVEADA